MIGITVDSPKHIESTKYSLNENERKLSLKF